MEKAIWTVWSHLHNPVFHGTYDECRAWITENGFEVFVESSNLRSIKLKGN